MNSWDLRVRAARESVAMEVLADPAATSEDRARAERELLRPCTPEEIEDALHGLTEEELERYLAASRTIDEINAKAGF